MSYQKAQDLACSLLSGGVIDWIWVVIPRYESPMLHKSTGAKVVTVVMDHEGTRGLVHHCPATIHIKVAEVCTPMASPALAASALIFSLPVPPALGKTVT